MKTISLWMVCCSLCFTLICFEKLWGAALGSDIPFATPMESGMGATNGMATQAAPEIATDRSIADRRLQWPSWQQWWQLLLLKDYNTRVVVLGVTLLGAAAGMVGSFTLLRKRALMGDALSHATLPGIGLAFVIANRMGADGKSLPILLCGATVTGLIGLGVVLILRHSTRLKEDTALGAVLSVFFGGGVALLGVIQQMREGHAAGLESFIYGKTASMGIRDVQLIAVAALGCMAACILLFKELKLLCFDGQFAGSRGFPAVRLDVVLMGLVVTVCIVGLQAVGLILVIALLIIPAAAARFWTEKMWVMFFISGCLGAVGGMVGAGMSAVFARLPSGAMIVLVCTAFFLMSMVFGTSRGMLVRWLQRSRLNRSIDRQHLLRAAYELTEPVQGSFAYSNNQNSILERASVSMQDLMGKRSWSSKRLGRAIHRAQRAGLIIRNGDGVALTAEGTVEAARLTRQHRLWEIFLITYADVAPSRVDREADAIEHVLEPELVRELESLLDQQDLVVPPSPHPVEEFTI